MAGAVIFSSRAIARNERGRGAVFGDLPPGGFLDGILQVGDLFVPDRSDHCMLQINFTLYIYSVNIQCKVNSVKRKAGRS